MRGRLFSTLLALVFLLNFNPLGAQSLLQGYVFDAESGEALPGVNVWLVAGEGTSTRADGYFQIQLTEAQEVHFSFVGYAGFTYQHHSADDTLIRISLSPQALITEEIVIEGNRVEDRLTQLVDRVQLDLEAIENMPHLLGEVDPVRVVQMMPGVQNSGDGNTGFYVRGGEVDQNLILLDKATIYNASHLFGFFSVFNGNTIEQVTLDKGGIPAYYGGRLSSVLNVKTKAGNKQVWKGKASLGLVAANLKLEGPVVKGKSSLMLAGRRTYYDVLQKSLLKNNKLVKSGPDYYFHDLNLKWDYLLSGNDKLVLSAYVGNDHFRYANFDAFQNEIHWGNQAVSLQWQHSFSSKWLSETTLFGSQYAMGLNASVSSFSIQIASDVAEKGLHQEFVYTPNQKQSLTLGSRLIQYRFMPGAMQANSQDQQLDFGDILNLHAREAAAFAHYEHEINEKWKASLGLRASYYKQVGPFQYYGVDANGRHTDTLIYRKNEKISDYLALEPRVSLSYSLSKNTIIKAAYDRTVQYIHMAPMSSVSLPTDVWVPSSRIVKPQKARQYSLGYYRLLYDFEGSLTAYYKSMKQQLEYESGVLTGQGQYQNFDDKFYFGKAHSYGLEWMLKKPKGKLNGWLSYTLSRTCRKFEDINQGKLFPAKYDRLHNLSLSLSYRNNPKWHFSSVFVLSSGNTMTLPVARYIMQGNIVNEYNGRNNYRLPSYHRLDLSATYYPNQQGKLKAYWVFSLYNVYSKMNAYYIYFDIEGSLREYSLEVSAKQVSLFPVIPSVSYNINF